MEKEHNENHSLIVFDLQGVPAKWKHSARVRYVCEFIHRLAQHGNRICLVLSDTSLDITGDLRSRFKNIVQAKDFFLLPNSTIAKSTTPDANSVNVKLQRAFIASLNPGLVLVPRFNPTRDSLDSVCIEAYHIDSLQTKGPLVTLRIPNELSQERVSESEAPNTLPFLVNRIFSARPSWNREKQIRGQLLGISTPYALCLSTQEDTAAAKRCLVAARTLPQSLWNSCKLVIAYVTDTDRTELQCHATSLGIDHHFLQFTEITTDYTWRELYSLSSVAILAAAGDEVQLMAWEASQCGTPVITLHDIESLPSYFEQKGELPPKPTSSHHHAFEFSEKDEVFHQLQALLSTNSLNSHDLIPLLKEQLDEIAQSMQPDDVPDELYEFLNEITRRFDNQSRRHRLFVDISELCQHDARTGIQRVTRAVLAELLSNPPDGYDVVPVYATREQSGYREARKYLQQTWQQRVFDVRDVVVFPVCGDQFLGLDLQQNIVVARQQDLQSMQANGVKVNFVVYDLLPLFLPNAFPPGTAYDHYAWLSVIAGMDQAICISHTVANELYDWIQSKHPDHANSIDISWFHLGADISSSLPSKGIPEQATPLLKHLLNRTSFLLVGTLEPRKGLEQVLDAFEILWNEGIDINLVFVGKQGWQMEHFGARLQTHEAKNHRLFWLSGISDEYLEALYASATCMIAASTGEGFGLPLIEAARHKLPIIARDLPVFREVAGHHASYFQGHRPDDLAKFMKQWINGYSTGKIVRSDDLPWLTWQQSVTQLKDVMFKPDKPNTLVTTYPMHCDQSTDDGEVAELLDQMLHQSYEFQRRSRLMEEFFHKESHRQKMEQDQQREALKSALKEREDLKCTLARREAELSERSREIAALNDEANEKNRNIVAAQKGIFELQQQLSAAQKNEAQLHVVLSSTSWKLTKPLRYFGEFARQLSLARNQLKHLLKERSLTLFESVIRHPHLTRRASKILLRIPWLHRQVSLAARRLQSRAASRKRARPGVKLNLSTSDTDLDRLGFSPDTQALFLALKKSIHSEKNY